MANLNYMSQNYLPGPQRTILCIHNTEIKLYIHVVRIKHIVSYALNAFGEAGYEE